jgi:hypothetical protein
MDAGLFESKSGFATLDSEFPPSLLLTMIRYIYNGKLEQGAISSEEGQFLESNGGLYRVFELEDPRIVTAGFDLLMLRARAAII